MYMHNVVLLKERETGRGREKIYLILHFVDLGLYFGHTRTAPIQGGLHVHHMGLKSRRIRQSISRGRNKQRKTDYLNTSSDSACTQAP